MCGVNPLVEKVKDKLIEKETERKAEREMARVKLRGGGVTRERHTYIQTGTETEREEGKERDRE